jgi:ligand-binding sensor domain-containing protein/DNA-binding CsgD family transcriptional regulator
MKKSLIFFLWIITGFSGYSQIKNVGIPFIINHERNTYNASTQNWSATQSRSGFMYFGNNDGILQYDGTSWELYPVPNNSTVRSVYALGDTIYAGAFENIGFLAKDLNGVYQWNSLNHLIPEKNKNFDEVWRIFKYNESIVFQSFQYVFVLQNNEIDVIEPIQRFSFLHYTNNKFFIIDRGQGLLQLENDSLKLISNHPVFFNNEINSILHLQQNSYIIGTTNNGLYLWEGETIEPWNTDVNEFMTRDKLFSAIELKGQYFAFASVSNGVFFADHDGVVLQHLNRVKGLQNNTVLSVFQDGSNNIWLGLDNGIDFVEISSPLSLLNYNYNIESAYGSISHNGIFYVATNQGLFAAPASDLQNNTDDLSGFQLIKGTEGQVWSLQKFGNTLLCGNNFGCFQIEDFNARQVSDIRGFWSFMEIPQKTDTILAGTYTGLVTLEKRGSSWYFLNEVQGFTESSRDPYLDKDNSIWISHGYKGIFRLEINEDLSRITKTQFFYDESGLPSMLPYNLQRLNNELVISTQQGIMQFNTNEQQFVMHPEFNELFEGKGFLDKIYQDTSGNLWYFAHDYLGIMRRLEDGSYQDVRAPFTRINDFLLPAFQNIFIADAQNIFIGSQNGLIHYNSTIINDYYQTPKVQFRDISFYGADSSESMLVYDHELSEKYSQVPKIDFSLNSVLFRFTAPVFENPGVVDFSYRLKGFDTNWSEWDSPNFKEYTNLPEGNYIFEIKTLNAFEQQSDITVFAFTIEPPWIRSAQAYAVFVILLVIIIGSNIYFVRRRMLKIRQREKFKHEKKLEQREKMFQEQSALSEKEIVHLRNESLKNEMNHKNKELANATLHLIQKNKTLTSLKNDLNKLIKNIPSNNPEKQTVNNLLKKVNRDLRNEKNWELFNSYFDDVHQDFIARLKEKHKDLTPKELRLCAYLRMNLSTKEIAPLMNISIRGVEISRYRLRKKLALDHDLNLADYLISY